jgi:hypothetical protein
MKKLITIITILMAVNAFAESKEEILKSIPAKYQGSYYMIGYSNDEGETIQDINEEFFCRFYGTKVVNFDNDYYVFSKILRISVSEDNSEVLLVYLNTGHTWIMSFPDKDNKRLVVIKDYATGTGEERSRSVYIKK